MRSRPVLVLAVVAAASVLIAVWAIASNRGDNGDDKTAVTLSATTTSSVGAAPSTTAAEPPECSQVDTVAEWDLRQRLSQMLMIGVSSEAEATQLLATRASRPVPRPGVSA